jgi:hypothetical protein
MTFATLSADLTASVRPSFSSQNSAPVPGSGGGCAAAHLEAEAGETAADDDHADPSVLSLIQDAMPAKDGHLRAAPYRSDQRLHLGGADEAFRQARRGPRQVIVVVLAQPLGHVQRDEPACAGFIATWTKSSSLT